MRKQVPKGFILIKTQAGRTALNIAHIKEISQVGLDTPCVSVTGVPISKVTEISVDYFHRTVQVPDHIETFDSILARLAALLEDRPVKQRRPSRVKNETT